MGDPVLLQNLPDIAPLLPQGGGKSEQAAAADGTCGPKRLLAAWVAQRQCQLKRGLKDLANRQAALLQGGPVNCCLLVVVSVAKQLLLA